MRYQKHESELGLIFLDRPLHKEHTGINRVMLCAMNSEEAVINEPTELSALGFIVFSFLGDVHGVDESTTSVAKFVDRGLDNLATQPLGELH